MKITGGIKSALSVIAMVYLMYIFTFYIDGEMGMILIAFVFFAPVISLIFAVYAMKRIKISVNCDGYVKKGSMLDVNVTVEKTGAFPLAVVEIKPEVSEVFDNENKVYRLSLVGIDKKTFSFSVPAKIGGNGEISLSEVYSCGFLGFIRFRIEENIPQPVNVGVIPDIPQIKASSQLFRSIADEVITADNDDENDTAMMFSTNTAPGYEHREYMEGDPLKRVNWKLSSKKQKLMVRLDEAVASVQPVLILDNFRSSSIATIDSLAAEESIIRSAFSLLQLLIRQGIACTFVYKGSGGETLSENVDNPEYPSQLLLKVLAVKVIPDSRIDLSNMNDPVCACVIASTDIGEGIAGIVENIADKESISLIAPFHDSKNLTDLPMWYLDGDNNFKQV